MQFAPSLESIYILGKIEVKCVQFKLAALTLALSFGASAAVNTEELTISQLHQAVKENKTTFKQTMQDYLNAIAQSDQKGAKLNSVIRLNDQAIAQAEAADAAYKKTGELKPLQGVPVLLKDNVDTAGLLTTGGSISLKDNVPAQDAFIAQKLKDAGAIVIAKTNLHEFAVWGETRSSMLGQTLNPYDLTRTPGGSSGGTGASVAANFGIVGIGTDTINSIRSPASANSLVGIRPTIGLVSRGGIIPYSFTQDTAGPITRTVEDAAKTLNALVAYDPADQVTVLAKNIKVDYTQSLKADGLKNKRIGVLNSFFGTAEQHQATNTVIRNSVEQMKQAGATIIELDTPIDADALVKNVSVHLYDLEEDLNTYLAVNPKQKPVGDLKALIASGQFDAGIKSNIETAVTLSKKSDEYKKRLKAREQLQKDVQKLMKEQKLDAVVFPHQKRLVVPVGETQVERNGVLGSVTGYPSIVVPAGFSPKSETAPLGVPVGLEIFGLPLTEDKLIEIAYAYEQHYPMRQKPVLK
jgi:amidase